jgi:hypothetical protein
MGVARIHAVVYHIHVPIAQQAAHDLGESAGLQDGAVVRAAEYGV